jgi:uncharacterized protein
VLRFSKLPAPSDLPPALAETIPNLPLRENETLALICSGFTCQPPIKSADELRAAQQQLLENKVLTS